MNKRKYMFVFVVYLLILHFASAGIGNRGYAHHRKNYRKHSSSKLKEIGAEIGNTNTGEMKQIPERSDQKNIDEDSEYVDSDTNGVDLDSEDIAADDFVENDGVPERSQKQTLQILNASPPQRRLLQGKIHKTPVDNEDKLGDESEEEDSNNDEDYVRQIPYDPDMPYSIKKYDRAKRLISSQEEESKHLKDDSEIEKENVEYSDIEEDLYKDMKLDDESDVSAKVKAIRKKSPSTKKKSGSDGNVKNSLVSKLTDLNSELQSTASKTVAILSGPKAAINSVRSSTNGPSQAFKNLVELNKAFKLLQCASNKFIKVANKTLIDRMLEECATMNSTKTVSTTDNCKTTACGTTELYGGDCCIKSNSLIATTGKSGGSKEDSDDAVVEDLLEITIKPRKKQGQRQNKELLSWIKGHGSYDSIPGMTMIPAQDIYLYNDYDNGELAEEEEEQSYSTENVRRMSSPAPYDKEVSKTNESSSLAEKSHKEYLRRKQIMSKAIIASRAQSSPRTLNPSTQVAFNEAEMSSADTEDSTSSLEKQGTVRIHNPRNYKHLRRMKFSKKFPPVSFAQTHDPGIVENSLLEDLSSNLVKDSDKSNIIEH